MGERVWKELRCPVPVDRSLGARKTGWSGGPESRVVSCDWGVMYRDGEPQFHFQKFPNARIVEGDRGLGDGSFPEGQKRWAAGLLLVHINRDHDTLDLACLEKEELAQHD